MDPSFHIGCTDVRRKAMGMTCLGRVPRPQMGAELARADVVVLPSIAEGSAGATYEALAAGIPWFV